MRAPTRNHAESSAGLASVEGNLPVNPLALTGENQIILGISEG